MPFPKKESEELLARTGRRCCICGTLHRVQLHHIIPKSDGGNDRIENAIPLCPNCHDDVHGSYGSGRTTRSYTPDELKLHIARTVDLVANESVSRERLESLEAQLRDVKNAFADFTAKFDLNDTRIKGKAEAMSTIKGAEGLFVVPKASSVAARLGIYDPLGAGYGQLLKATIFTFLAKQRAFRVGVKDLAVERLRMRESAANALRTLEQEIQGEGDFLVFPAQTGMKYGGYSVRNARWEIEHAEWEFPLPTWCVGYMLLANPQRFRQGGRWLGIDCPGDECRTVDGGEFDRILCFAFDSKTLHLNARRVDRPDGRFGSASGWAVLPEPERKDSGSYGPRTSS